MTSNTIRVTLPGPVLQRLRRVAELTHRSVDDVVAATVNAALSAPLEAPATLADELAAMNVFSDNALWAAAQPSISAAEQQRLHQLNHLAGEYGLTPAEASEQTSLLYAYHRSMLRRAQALAILAQRRHSISLETLRISGDNGSAANSPSSA